ncbi:hypothetical protein ACQUSY_02455 [Microbacterium sp. YY-03]|uniref:hypothetical protein n=1 Tax=Microbacterium sp. YY-03 TaxID=3421636 RepID=UPI003D1740AF
MNRKLAAVATFGIAALALALDGTTGLRRFRYIVFPYLRSVFTVVLILQVIWNLNIFTQVYALQSRGGTCSPRMPTLSWSAVASPLLATVCLMTFARSSTERQNSHRFCVRCISLKEWKRYRRRRPRRHWVPLLSG